MWFYRTEKYLQAKYEGISHYLKIVVSLLLRLCTANISASLFHSWSLSWGSQRKHKKNGRGHQAVSGTGKAEGDWLICAMHNYKSWASGVPLFYRDKQNMLLLCNFPQCPELCRWQPGQQNRASSVYTRWWEFNTQLWQMRRFFKAICVLEHLKCFLPEATWW